MHSATTSLVMIPNTDTSRLKKILDEYSGVDGINTIHHEKLGDKLSCGFTTSAMAFMLVEPTQRLYSAYCTMKQLKSDTSTTFKAFYTNKQRLNFYSKLLNGTEVGNFGFIGIRECFHKSVLLYADYLNVDLCRIPYSALPDSDICDVNQISDEDRINIRELYANDYAIYEKAKSLFLEKWKRYQQKNQITIAKDKKIIVHLGPPKTGTSAIQSWLNQNALSLNKHDIFYPGHTADENGVSSGNFEHILSLDTSSGNYYFDDNKLRDTVRKFENSNMSTLLLSSEHFYYYLIWFFSRLPEATFIFYIRHPLALIESAFNQEVKRHLRTSPFSIPEKIRFNALEIVSNIANEFQCKVNYAYFDNKLFYGGTLLSDFLHQLNIENLANAAENDFQLNRRYSPGALFLMRLCNGFTDANVRRRLDIILQEYSETQEAFSCMSETVLAEANKIIEDEAVHLANINESLDLEKLMQLVSAYRLPRQADNLAVDADLTKLLKYVRAKNKALYSTLIKQAMDNRSSPGAEAFLSSVKLTMGEKAKLTFKKIKTLWLG